MTGFWQTVGGAITQHSVTGIAGFRGAGHHGAKRT